MKIVVLAGGLSPERDVSFSSGSLIANALIENGHEVMLLDLYLGIKNTDFPPVFKDKNCERKFYYSVPETEPDLAKLKESSKNGEKQIGDGVLDICQKADAVFLALHGSIGENGQLQAVFDTFGIRYTGTGYTGSLLAMNKDISKRLMKANTILTPGWQYFDLKCNRPEIPATIKYPCVVKPCSCGSSVGVTIVENATQLAASLDKAKKYEDSILIEEKINGREFSVGVLNGAALPPVEIIPITGFYDYKNKYQSGMTKEVCPADVTGEVTDMLKATALKVHNLLKLGYYSRVDFILDKNNNAYCLEANTLPGMTPTSLLPREALAVGISYNELCERIALSK